MKELQILDFYFRFVLGALSLVLDVLIVRCSYTFHLPKNKVQITNLKSEILNLKFTGSQI